MRKKVLYDPRNLSEEMLASGHVHLPTVGTLGFGWSCSSTPQLVRLVWHGHVHLPTIGTLGLGWSYSYPPQMVHLV